MMRHRVVSLLFAAIAARASLACESASAVKEPAPDASAPATSGSPDGGATIDGGDEDCFDAPKTHDEIINACTDAVKIAKNPTLKKLTADGGRPPLE